MKKLIILCASLLFAGSSPAQVTSVTNTLGTASKTISDSNMGSIIAGVNAMGIGSGVVTTSNLDQATVLVDGPGSYRVFVGLRPTVTSVTNISDTGIESVTEKTVSTLVSPISLDSTNMEAIFAMAVGQVGNMSSPLTITNFISLTLGKSTNSPGSWRLTAIMKNK